MKQDLHLHKILHRLLGAWIAAIMLLAAGSAAAQTTFTVDNIKYTVTGTNTVSITNRTYSFDATTLNLPSVTNENKTYIVTRISPQAFETCKTLISVTFPNVTDIDYNAFIGCENLASATFPKATIVGDNAFNDCPNLKNIDFPKVITLGVSAFDGCASLTKVSFPNAVNITGINIFRNCTQLSSAIFPKAEGIFSCMFLDDTNLTSASFPNATYIGTYAFDGCSKLEEVTVPNVNEIQSHAFYNCSSLKSITAPKVHEIGEEAFSGCTSLKSAIFLNLEGIGKQAFSDCDGLTTLYLGANAPTSIGTDAFSIYPPKNLYIVDAEGKAAATTNYGGTTWNYFTITALPETSAIINITGVPTTIQRTATGKETFNLNDTVQIYPTKYLRDNICWTVVDAGETNAIVNMPATGDTTLSVSGPGLLLFKATVTASNPDYSQTFPIQVTGRFVGDTITVDSIKYKISSLATGDSTVTVVGYTFTTPKALNITYILDNGDQFTVDNIGDGALKDAPLTSVSFPNVKNIGANAFENDTLSAASFPALATIGEEAFKNCSHLAHLSLGTTAPTVSTDAFSGCPSSRSLTFIDKKGNQVSDSESSLVIAKQYKKRAGYADGTWYGWLLPATVYVGSAPLFVPATGTAYYTYSEASGSSVLTPSDANTYNVSASFTDKTLNITLQNITVNDSHESVYDPNKQITVHPALFIAYTEGNTHLNTQEATVLQSSYDYQAAGGIYYFSYDSTTQESDTLILNNSGSLISGYDYKAIKGDNSTQGLYHTNFDCSFGITTIGNLVIDNSGEMTMKPNRDNMYGIDVHGSLLIKGTGSLDAYATSPVSYSIMNSSYGIKSEKKITVSLQSSGSLYASGIHQYESSRNGYSYGIYAPEIEIKSGSFFAQGSTQAMNVPPTFTGSAIASEDYYGNDAVVYNANNISTYQFIRNGFSSYIGNAPLNISSTGTTYYIYSEAGGNSSLTPSNADNYNVSASLSSDLVLNLTFKGLKVNVNYDDSSYGYAVYLDGAMTKVKLNMIGDNTLTGLASQKKHRFFLFECNY